ncbi:hemicentin-2-like isoform X2 [Haliotis rubra]|nr:hemicentin-2-like isoform X2 [Haliotis rubra]
MIYINKVSDEELGTYNCLVNTSQGSLLSETVILRLAGIQEPHIVSGKKRKSGVDSLPCDVLAYSVPRGKVTWMKSGKELLPSENVYINMDGALVFLYLTKEDIFKLYSCNVYNSILNKTIVGNTTFLTQDEDVGTGLQRPQTRPKLISRTGSVSVAEGDDVILECVFGGEPEPTVTWTRKYAHEARHKYSYPATKGKQLRIASTSVSDGGDYTCKGKNTLTKAESTVTVHIEKRPALLIPSSIESRFLVAGDNITYDCAPEKQGMESKWLLDGKPVVEGMDMLLLSSNKQSLTITSTSSDRDGLCVQCNVSNDIAYTLYSACVRYVATEADLPTTTQLIPTSDTQGTQSTELWWIPIPVVIVTAAAIVIVVTVVCVRRRRANEKKRLSTVGSTVDLPNKASIYWEAHQMIEQKPDKGRIAQIEKKQQQDDLWNNII